MSPPRLQSIVLSWAAVLAALCLIAASFDVQTIPGNAANTRVFIAQADSDAAAELFIVSGLNLTMVNGGPHEDTVTFSLEDGTTAIDVADVDGDGTAEIYTVAGNEIRQRSLIPQQGSGTASRLLFSRETLLSTSDGGPQPYVIVTKWQGRPALALPDKDGLSILTLDGTVLKHFPREPANQAPVRLQHTLVTPPQVGPPGALEFWADVTFDAPTSPVSSHGSKEPRPSSRRASYTQAREASKLPPEDWPWFLLAPAKSSDQRVMYTLAGFRHGETLIRIRNRGSGDLTQTSTILQYSPERRYPGTLVIPPGPPPDFNSDGYSDLLVWSSPRPGTSIDSLMRAAQARTWPVRLTTHLFSSAKGIYAGRPSARIELLLPIAWSIALENGLPLRHLVLQDINGDGRTDIGVALSPTRFALWICTMARSFSAEPDYTVDLPEAIEGIALVAHIGDGNSAVIALRGTDALYLLTLPDAKS